MAVDQTEPVTSALRYISHPNVLIDPDVPVPDWSLNAEGQRRAQAMTTMAWTASIGRIISSDETKARMTADILAAALGLEVEVRPETGEIDRSATGYLSHERHSELARRLFAEPDVSAEGWETATDAQARVVSALTDVLAAPPADETSDVAVIGHGGVGTLLYCHLAGLGIDVVHDQPGQGHFWTYNRASQQVQHTWQAIDHDGLTDADQPN